MTPAQLLARREELLTVKEFAQLTRRCEKTIYRRIWAGRQRGALRDDGRWLIDISVALAAVPAPPVSKQVPSPSLHRTPTLAPAGA